MPKTGKSTGERITGEVVQAIIAASAIGRTPSRIRKLTGAHSTTVKAVLEREAATIGQRRNELAPIFARAARLGAELMVEEITSDKLTPVARAMLTGIATDKLIALTPTDAPTSPNLHLHLSGQDVAGQWNALLASIQSKPVKATIIEADNAPASSVDAHLARTPAPDQSAPPASQSPLPSLDAVSNPQRAPAHVIADRVRAITSPSASATSAQDQQKAPASRSQDSGATV